MRNESFESYMNNFIDFYKNFQTSDERLKSLIIRNLHNIKARGLKEIQNKGEKDLCQK